MHTKLRRVLVVDGIDERRPSIRMALEAAGFEVSIAGSVRRALRLLKSKRFDVIVADICTPQAGGLTIIKRAHNEQAHLRLFAMASGDSHFSIETASTLAEVWGAERVFTSKFDAAALLDAINREPAVEGGAG